MQTSLFCWLLPSQLRRQLHNQIELIDKNLLLVVGSIRNVLLCVKRILATRDGGSPLLDVLKLLFVICRFENPLTF